MVLRFSNILRTWIHPVDFTAPFNKEDKFCDFLFAFLVYTKIHNTTVDVKQKCDQPKVLKISSMFESFV